jgi:dienelactone hydrolase
MSDNTFVSAGITYKITVYSGATSGKRFPAVLLVHGNAGLGPPYGEPIREFAKALAGRGYVTAVPQYYKDDAAHLADTVPHDHTLADAVQAVTSRPDVDGDRVGLIGFSLGAATAMTFVASHPAGTVKALADFFGFLTPTIQAGLASFPPTIIFHNKNDEVVPVVNSQTLDRLLPGTIDHTFVGPYDEHWELNHAFKPGGAADVDSRSKATDWFVKHLPPTGK